MLNMNLSYKTPSPWRIVFWSVGCPRQFSRLKKSRALVVPSGGCRKGIIIQGILMPTGVLPIGQSCFRIKGDVTGASLHVPNQRNITYVQTVRRSNLRDQTTITPSLANPTILTMPPGTLFTVPLHVAHKTKDKVGAILY